MEGAGSLFGDLWVVVVSLLVEGEAQVHFGLILLIGGLLYLLLGLWLEGLWGGVCDLRVVMVSVLVIGVIKFQRGFLGKRDRAERLRCLFGYFRIVIVSLRHELEAQPDRWLLRQWLIGFHLLLLFLLLIKWLRLTVSDIWVIVVALFVIGEAEVHFGLFTGVFEGLRRLGCDFRVIIVPLRHILEA